MDPETASPPMDRFTSAAAQFWPAGDVGAGRRKRTCPLARNRPNGERPPARGRAGDPLLQEVRWRLFRREDLPARLRRLQRMEETAFDERTRGEPRGEADDAGG